MKSTKKKHIQDYHMVTISSFREVVQYIYYRFSEFYKRTEGENSSYKYTGFLLIIFFSILNFFSIVSLLDVTYLGLYFDKILSIPFFISEYRFIGRILFGVGGLIIFSTVLYIMLGKESYLEIYQKFHKETLQQRKKRGWFIAIYMVLTPIIFIIAVSIKHRYF